MVLVVYWCKSQILCGNLVQELVHIASIIFGGVQSQRMHLFMLTCCYWLGLSIWCSAYSLSDVLLLFLSYVFYAIFHLVFVLPWQNGGKHDSFIGSFLECEWVKLVLSLGYFVKESQRGRLWSLVLSVWLSLSNIVLVYRMLNLVLDYILWLWDAATRIKRSRTWLTTLQKVCSCMCISYLYLCCILSSLIA